MFSKQLFSSQFDKYSRALEEDPASRAFAPLAELYRKHIMLDKAVEILRIGIRYNPSYVLGYSVLAQCYLDMERPKLAYNLLKPLVDDNTDNIKLLRIFAEACEVTDYLEEALRTYKLLLFLNPKDNAASNFLRKIERLDEKTDGGLGHKLFKTKFLAGSPSSEFDSLDDWHEVNLPNATHSYTTGEGSTEDQWSMEEGLRVAKVIKREVDHLDEGGRITSKAESALLSFYDGIQKRAVEFRASMAK